MKSVVFTIYDKLAKESGPLFQAKNVDVAQREFNNLVKDLPEDTKEDYELVILATYDNESMAIALYDGIDLLEAENV